ncbi:MAG: phosphatase PAP2 family protein [Bacteroidales bacterium]|nr:phosphatase PAP2 family protein [Bacteroidales bacterium]
MIKRVIKDNYIFILPFTIIWIIMFVLLMYYGKINCHLLLNSFHTTIGDYFFKYITEVGGSIPFIILGLLLFYNYRNFIFLGLSQGLSSLITFVIKRVMQIPRPSVIFNELGIELPVVNGVDLHHSLSFPSGHTTTAFATFFVLAVIIKNKYIKLLCLIIAILGGYSRIYLSQHFITDVLAGALIGLLSAIIISPIFYEKQWGNSNLIKTIKNISYGKKKN